MEIAHYFTSHMVLQRESMIPLFGTDEKGQGIKVSFLGISYETEADEKGHWEVQLHKALAGGPYTMKIQGSSEIILEDIMIGDVYLLGGQSNMELRIMDALDAMDETVLQDHDSSVRYLRIEPRYRFDAPEESVSTQTWKRVDPESIQEFSAIGYFFAKEIRKKVKVPIGLINTAVGGSCIEAWMAPHTLSELESYESTVAPYLVKGSLEQTIISQQDEKAQWKSEIDQEPASVLNEVFSSAELMKSEWESYPFPNLLKEVYPQSYQGSIWLVKDFTLQQEPKGKSLLRMGLMIDSDKVWINGVEAGAGEHRYQIRWYEVPQGVLKKGTNRLLVQLTIENGNGGFVPYMPYYLKTESEKIILTKGWKWKKGIEKRKPAPQVVFPPLLPIGLYLGVLVPIAKLTFKAVLWYQGESNTGHSEDYTQLFRSMKQDWEKLFNRPLQFCCVQLPGYQEVLDPKADIGWAMIREYQRRCEHEPDRGMITAVDLGEHYDLHPHHKQEIGRRLALWAFNYIYGYKTVCSGPSLKRYKCMDNQIMLYFDHDDWEEEVLLPLFEASLNGISFKAVKAVHHKGCVRLELEDKASEVQKVRYAWGDAPQPLAYYNQQGLPAGPFLLEIGGQ